VYVTGRSDNDFATVKYNSAGVQQWVSRYNGPGSQYDQVAAITLDESGNVYVTGTSSRGLYDYDQITGIFTTIKYTQSPTFVNEHSQSTPNNFALEQNYPNPFNPSTVISYQLPVNSMVSLKIYDLLGREIATLVNEEQSAGWKEVKWNASAFSSGFYFYKLQTGNFVDVKKMLVVK
jgi:hypothetical protein